MIDGFRGVVEDLESPEASQAPQMGNDPYIS